MMQIDSMVHKMCTSELVQKDLKEIVRSRGFPIHGSHITYDLLEHHFLRDTGVEKVLATLSEDEIRILHLLNAYNGDVPIHIFAPVFPSQVNQSGYTYNDKYKALLKEMRSHFIQKGILLLATLEKQGASRLKTKLERHIFRFPPSFAAFLPPAVDSIQLHSKQAQPETNTVLRKNLMELPLRPPLTGKKSTCSKDSFAICNGDLIFNGNPFDKAKLHTWLVTKWAETIAYAPRLKLHTRKWMPAALMVYVLSRMAPDQWIAPSAIKPLLSMALYGKEPPPDADLMFQHCFAVGGLDRTKVDKEWVYRMSSDEVLEGADEDAPPGFTAQTATHAVLDVEHISFADLELLSQTGTFDLQGGLLIYTPDIRKITRLPDPILTHTRYQWMCKHIDCLSKALAKIEARQGKTLLHKNLMIAQIKDLGLRVMLENAFKGRIVMLSKEFIAFPPDLLPDIEKRIKKSGHVIKTVEAYASDKT